MSQPNYLQVGFVVFAVVVAFNKYPYILGVKSDIIMSNLFSAAAVLRVWLGCDNCTK